MANSRRKTARRFPSKGHRRSRFELEEFGPGKTDILLCPRCNAAYYHKSWHHTLEGYDHLTPQKQVGFAFCPACAMWKKRTWEGEIHIAGIPARFEEQIYNTILAVADEAYRRDPMDRVFDIKKMKKEWIVYTSENQLAQRIARKIYESFKTHFTKPRIAHGKKGDAFLITMEWVK